MQQVSLSTKVLDVFKRDPRFMEFGELHSKIYPKESFSWDHNLNQLRDLLEFMEAKKKVEKRYWVKNGNGKIISKILFSLETVPFDIQDPETGKNLVIKHRNLVPVYKGKV